MGATEEGSSAAALGAQTPQSKGRVGLLGRLLAVFSSTGRGEDDDERAPGSPSGQSLIGLGNLRAMRVQDVAVPRAEIIAVPADIGLQALVSVFRESGLSRLPVYRGTLDTPIGLVHLKDLALSHGFNGRTDKTAGFDLAAMVRPLLYAPPSMPIGVLLSKMQSERTHMALVIDEYGGVDGLVTIEDLIEQVIGEIEDEHDTAEGAWWVEESPGCFLAQARTPLDEFEDVIAMKLLDAEEEEEIDTLGGLVFMLAGHVPARGEVVAHPLGVEFEVVEADPRRIKKLRVRLSPEAARAHAQARAGAG